MPKMTLESDNNEVLWQKQTAVFHPDVDVKQL